MEVSLTAGQGADLEPHLRGAVDWEACAGRKTGDTVGPGRDVAFRAPAAVGLQPPAALDAFVAHDHKDGTRLVNAVLKVFQEEDLHFAYP